MSWDNVAGVSSAQIWADNPDMTQAWLFANGNHQVKLTIGISFNLTDKTQPGPTQDEVSAALTLINYESGAGLSYLIAGAAGDYLASYLPNTAPTVQQVAAADTGHFQYEILYYLSSDSTINPSYMSESVALLLTYTNKDGQEIEYSTASNSKSQSLVTVNISSPKKYGNSDLNMTPVIIPIKHDQAGYSIVSESTNARGISESSMQYSSLRIDDSYFRLISFQASDEIKSPLPFYIDGTEDKTAAPNHGYDVTEGYLPTENKLNQGRVSYNSLIEVRYSRESDGDLYNLSVSVTQAMNEIIFIHYTGTILYESGSFTKTTNDIAVTGFDQFGNQLNASVGVDSNGFNITSVT